MKLNEALSEFRTHLAIARSGATAKTYGTALTHLASYATIGGVTTVDQIHPGHFLAYLGDKSLVTLGGYMTALSQFAEFCHDEDILANGAYVLFKRRLKRLRGRAPARKIPAVPTEEVFQAVLAEARKPFIGTARQHLGHLRGIAMLETLRSTGCRAAEVVSLRRRDLKGKTARIIGKGRKTRVIFFDEAAEAAIETYISIRGDSDPDNPVFARHDRLANGVMPLSTTSVRDLIDRLAIAANVDPKAISPHKFRHRFATRILIATGNLACVQDLLGHSSPNTTRVYSQLSNEYLADIHGSVVL